MVSPLTIAPGAVEQRHRARQRHGEAHRLVGDHAPAQARRALQRLDQLGHAVEDLRVAQHPRLVVDEELLAQLGKFGRFGRDAEGHAQHAARAGAGHRPIALQRQRRQAALGAHLVGRGAQVGRAVDQGAVQVEQDGFGVAAPSRSNRRLLGGEHVVDAGVAAQPVAPRHRVVLHAAGMAQVEAGGAAVRGQFARPDQLLVLVRAARQHAEHVLGADDREQEGLQVAVDGREEHPAAGLDEVGAGLDDRGRIGHVFEHFHAGHDVEAARLLGRQRLGADLAVLDAARAGLQRMQLRHLERLVGQVDAQHLGALARHRVGQDAAAAADVEHALARRAARCRRSSPGAAD